MSDKEGKVLKIYDGSRPRDEDLYDLTWVNQVPGSRSGSALRWSTRKTSATP
jgi:hypothetical protein